MEPAIARTVDPGRSFAEYVLSHERLLHAGAASVSVGVLSDLTISYGVGEPDGASYLVRARADGVSTIRRSSGGSGIMHAPGDLVWAVVLPRSDPRVGRDFVRAYGRFGRGLVTFLSEFGLRATWVPAPGLSRDYCPLSDRGLVLEVEGRVLAAAAQHLTGTTLLHHGTLPVSVDRARIARWFDLPVPGPTDRLTSLGDLGVKDRSDDLAQVLVARIAAGLESPGT